MRIAIDISSAVKPKGTGIAAYIRNLVRSLEAIDRENLYYLCCRVSRLKGYRYLLRPSMPNFRLKIFHEPLCFLFPRKIDIFHSGGTRIPRFEGPMLIPTLHDILLLTSDEFSNPDHRKKKISRFRDSAERAERIVTVSEFCRREIVRHLGIEPEKVAAIPHGVGKAFHPRAPEETLEVRRRLGVENPYVLFVGIIAKRKNVPRMVEAFAKALPRIDPRTVLLLAGRFKDIREDVDRLIGKLGIGDRVRLPGYVAQDDLPYLYAGARLLFFPSLYEGFGIPILESMASGVPVITSDRSAMPEVAGGAARIVNPEDVDEMARALEEVLEDEQLRGELIEKGLLRSREFTWERTARNTLELYRSLYRPRGKG